MNTKLLTSMGCLLLLAAAITPSAFGHSENNYKYTPENAQGVTGLYVGSAGPATADETDYPNTIAAGAILCDLEVAGDGTAHNPQDELRVDDGNTGGVVNDHSAEESPSDNDPNAGSLPDTWDDGGFGGACHTNSYVHGDYNTPGCPAGTAHAINEVDYNAGDTVTDTFLGASCDWKFSTGGTGATTTFQLCVINNAIQGGAANIPGCITTWLACMGDPTASCTVGGTEGCGSDGSSDGINYGHGSIGVPYPTFTAGDYVHQGEEAFNIDTNQDGTNEADCASSDATAQVFMFDAVNTNHLEDPAGSPFVHPALTGQIWQVAPGDVVKPFVPEPLFCEGTHSAVGWMITCPGASCTSTAMKVTCVTELAGDPVNACLVRPVTAFANLISAPTAADSASTAIYCDVDHDGPEAAEVIGAVAEDLNNGGQTEPVDSVSQQGTKTLFGVYYCIFEISDGLPAPQVTSVHVCRDA